MRTTFANMTHHAGSKAVQAASLGALSMTAIAISGITTPATAAPVTVDFEGDVQATVTVEQDFSNLLKSLNIPLPDSVINENIVGSVTVDDDASQYLDGDLSLGYDLLSSTLGVSIDQQTITALDNFLDLSVTGSGRVTSGAQTMNYSLRFNSAVDEFQAVFDNFDPNTEIISACASGACDWSGNFNVSLASEFLPAPLFGSLGSFAFTTNAEAGGTIGDFEVSSRGVTVSHSDGDLNISKQTSLDTQDAQAVPEPSTFLGMAMFFGVGAALKKKRSA